MSRNDQQPVVVLGAGANGCAVARELVLNGVAVWLVDRHDVASGATSRSSRLIHGGLRYLEYGDFGLVRESLAERERLLRLAGAYVRPLRLFIPVRGAFSGLLTSAARFAGAARVPVVRQFVRQRKPRGAWLVRSGLAMYDWLARGDAFPPHDVHGVGEPDVPQVDGQRYHTLCAYSDGQMPYPERFVIAMLADTARVASDRGVEFRVLTRRHATIDGERVELRDASTGERDEGVVPRGVVNATGAWGDRTLNRLGVESKQLFGGTKGSHLVSFHEGLRRAIGENAVYAESPDGRMVFVLPFHDAVLVGTTDEPFSGDPANALASDVEIDYLVEMVQAVFGGIGFTREDVDSWHAGVRPLPYVPGSAAGAVSRDHWIEEHAGEPFPVWTLVGGKLTTCRAFGEDVARTVLSRLDVPYEETTADRTLPGAVNLPAGAEALNEELQRLAESSPFDVESLRSVWRLCGSETRSFVDDAREGDGALLTGTSLPRAFARWVVDREWVTTLEDLVERRLVLVFQRELRSETLHELGRVLVQAGRLPESALESEVAGLTERLGRVYGKRVLARDVDRQAG